MAVQGKTTAKELEKKMTARKRWRVAYCVVRAQSYFQEQMVSRSVGLLALKQSIVARKIQRQYRIYLARAEEQQKTTFRSAHTGSEVEYAASQEHATAISDAKLSHEEELRDLYRLQDSNVTNRLSSLGPMATGTLGEVGTVGALGTVEGVHHDLNAYGQDALNVDPAKNGAHGSNGVPGFMKKQDTLKNADLSWVADEGLIEEGQDVAGNGCGEEMTETKCDLDGGGEKTLYRPLMAAEDEALNPIECSQDFPIGPPVPYKGGIFTCTLIGHRKQLDQDWGDEYFEYVLRCTWGRDILEQSKTAWLVGGRYNDFNVLHQELKAAASGHRRKRAPWFPRFPKRHPFSTMVGKNQREQFIIKREKELNRYMTQVLTQMPDALLNVHLDRFLNLTLRTQDIGEREAFAEARKRWEDEERQALVTAAHAEPLKDSELHEVEQLVHQLLQKIMHGTGDLRQATDLQEMIHAVKVLQPRVAASAQIGAGVDMELVPLAMQLQDDIQDAYNQYNDALLAVRLGHDLN